MMTSATDLMFIESTMPTFDAMIAEHAMVAADPATTCQSVRTLRERHCTPGRFSWDHANVDSRSGSAPNRNRRPVITD